MSERFLPVLDAKGSLIPEAPSILEAFMCFPEDVRSACWFAKILSEELRLVSADSDASLCHLCELMITDTKRRYPRAELAGHIVLSMAEMLANREKASLTRAIEFVSVFAREAKERLGANLPVHRQSIEEHAKQYLSVAHYWAARIAFFDLIEAGTEEAFVEFLGVAERFERIVESTVDLTQVTWNPWRVPQEFACPEFFLAVPNWKPEFSSAAKQYYRRNGN